MKTYTTILLLAFGLFCTAQKKDADPVKWTFDSNQVGPQDYELIFIANYDKPWVVYSQFTGDEGPIPTSINFTSKNVELIGQPKEKGKRVEKMDAMFGVEVIKFEGSEPYMIKQKVKIKDISEPVTGYVTFMTCDNQVCLPPKDVDFSFTFIVNDNRMKMSPGQNSVPSNKKVKKSF